MIETHRLFKHPNNQEQKIWRYFDFTKFVDLLNTESLYFSRSDKFDDIFEGSFPKESVADRISTINKLINSRKIGTQFSPHSFEERRIREKLDYAINCWHLNDYESAAMWKIYLKSDEGIAVQSRFSRLKSELDKSSHKIFLGVVNYKDYEKDYIDWSIELNAYLHKRNSFLYEKELRAIIWKPTETELNKIDLSTGGIKIKVDLKNLVENVFVSPKSPLWLTSLVKETCKRFGFEFKIINSQLDGKPMF